MSTRRETAVLRAADGAALATIARVGDTFFTSSIPGVDPATGRLGETAEAQFALAFGNLQALLERAAVSLDHVGQLTVFLADASYRPLINPPWLETFPGGDRPARKTTHLPLPSGQVVQLQALGVAGASRTPLEIPGLAHRDPLPMGVRIGDLVFSSVLGGDDPATGQRAEGVAQIRQTFANMRTLVERAGGGLADVGLVWVYLANESVQPAMIDAWLETFPADGDRPSRKTFFYDLGGRTTLVQLQLVAALGGQRANFELEGIGHHDPIPLAARVGGLVFSSGINGLDRATGALPADPYEQARLALENAGGALAVAGGAMDHLGHVTALIRDADDRAAVLRAWGVVFPDEGDQPALHIMQLGLAGRDVRVQLHLLGVE